VWFIIFDFFQDQTIGSSRGEQRASQGTEIIGTALEFSLSMAFWH
jgi:hypothetical protein